MTRRSEPLGWAAAAAGLLIALFFMAGLPYWDVDYTVNFAAALGHGWGELLWAWVSPVHAPLLPGLQQHDAWGFLDRQAQFVVYRLCYAVAGYDAWPYVAFKALCYAGLGAFIYRWSVRVTAGDAAGRLAAFAATLFFLLAPGPVASLVWLADFAPASELAFAGLSYALWSEIERTPRDRRLVRWAALVAGVYLAYKTKADVKLLPVIGAVYVLIVRRTQWRHVAWPLGAMLVLAVPWSASVVAPPFAPGAAPAGSGFFWHGASLASLREYLWSSDGVSLLETFGLATLLAVAGYAAWRLRDAWPPGLPLGASAAQRARLFVAIWLLAALAACSALPAINPFFRVRYGILFAAPGCILLAWGISEVAGACARGRVPRAVGYGFALLLVLQGALNAQHAMTHRAELGRVMVAVDRLYGYVARWGAGDTLAVLPGFLPYDYQHEVPAIGRRQRVAAVDALAASPDAESTWVAAWSGPTSPDLHEVAAFDGCRRDVLFDRVMPCRPGPVAHVMRYTGRPRTADAYVQLSQGLYEKRRFAKAAAAARAALRLRPKDAVAYNNLAAAYAAQRQWDRAIAAARAALRIDPGFTLAKNNLAWALAQQARRR